MTIVNCGFTDCIYNKDKECNKDKICLDELVADINIGCPNAEWESVANDAIKVVRNEYEAEFTDLPDIPRYYYEKVVGKMAHEINMLREQLESADATQGEWIDDKPTLHSSFAKQYRCSKCGARRYKDNYCSNCGARMKGGAE